MPCHKCLNKHRRGDVSHLRKAAQRTYKTGQRVVRPWWQSHFHNGFWRLRFSSTQRRRHDDSAMWFVMRTGPPCKAKEAAKRVLPMCVSETLTALSAVHQGQRLWRLNRRGSTSHLPAAPHAHALPQHHNKDPLPTGTQHPRHSHAYIPRVAAAGRLHTSPSAAQRCWPQAARRTTAAGTHTLPSQTAPPHKTRVSPWGLYGRSPGGWGCHQGQLQAALDQSHEVGRGLT